VQYIFVQSPINWSIKKQCIKEAVAIFFRTKINMKKRTFDLIIILLIAISLTILNQFELLEKSAIFMLIPILAFYFLGQYSERHLKK